MKSLAGAAVELAQRPAAKRTVNVFDGWREHPLLGLAIVLAGLLIGLPAAWILGRPQYFAEATIYVSPTFIKNLEEDSEQKRQYDTFVQQQVNTITRFDILSEALGASKQAGFVWAKPGESEKEAVERLREELQIRRIPETYQVAIGLRASTPVGLAEFINGLADNFLRKARAEEFYGQQERLDNLEKERAALDKDIATNSTKLAELAGDLGVANFSPQLVNPYDQVLTKYKEELNGSRQKRLEAEALVDVLQARTNPQNAGAGMIQQALAADPELTRMRNVLNARRLELTATMRGLAPEHPARQKAEREIEENEADLKRVTDRTQERIRVQTLATATEDLQRARHVERGLEQAIAQQESRASRFSRTLQQGMDRTHEIERMRARRNTIDDRIRYLTVEASAPGFLRLFAPAQKPEEPTRGKRTLLSAIVLGFVGLVGMMAPMAVEAFNSKVRNPAIVEEVLGFPPVGLVLACPDGRHRDFSEEHLARLIAGIERSHHTMMARTFLLAPLRPDSGNSELAMLIGAELWKRGHRTIVIQANAFSPEPGPGGRPGLQEVLNGTSPLAGSIVTGDGAFPDRIHTGGGSGSSRLNNLHAVGGLMDALHHQYDIVLVDAAPLFLSSDTEYLVRCVDVTLLNVDAARADKESLERAAALLGRLQPGGVGVILDGVRPQTAGAALRRDLREFQRYRRPSPVSGSLSAASESKTLPPSTTDEPRQVALVSSRS